MEVKELKGASQTYDWGKVGSESTVYTLLQAGGHGKDLDKNTPYAELWMGTHPSGPSHLYDRKANSVGQSLQQYIDSNATDSLGASIVSIFGNQLPFLLKVLSVRKALSIQVHPNKEHAEVLHKSQPNVYKDPNHKPEMAIALTKFEALCGFRTTQELKQILEDLPELSSMLGSEAMNMLGQCGSDSSKQQAALKLSFKNLMTTPEDRVKECLNKLVARSQLSKSDKHWDNISAKHPHLREVFLRVHEQYPGDVGCLGLFFLNYVTLQPGEGLFLEANLPHAYLYGDCVECMACSDNVIRAGLTPKAKDVATLLALLKYEGKPTNALRFQPQTLPASKDGSTVLRYDPPVPDFAVDAFNVAPKKSVEIPRDASASILLVVEGGGSLEVSAGPNVACARGQIFYLSAAATVSLKNTSNNAKLLAYRAFCSSQKR